MKIGIDASSLIQTKTGIGSFASSVLPEIKKIISPKHQLFLYQPYRQRDLRAYERMFWELFKLPVAGMLDKIDLLYSPGFSPPPFGNFKRVVTVHDLIGIIYPKNTHSLSRFYWSKWLPANVLRADACIASSESTRRDLEKYLGIRADAVEVVPLAASSVYAKCEASLSEITMEKFKIKKPFLISVGTLEPRKNGFRLAQAFARIAHEHPELTLVFVGKDGGLERTIRAFIEKEALNNRIKLLGYLTDQELVALYSAALGYVMISLYEGFGLPPLEAMSCGLTGVVSNVSSLPEVVGDTAWQANPENIQDISEALRHLINDHQKRSFLAEHALKRSAEFSYTKTATSLLKIFEKIAP